MASRKSPQKPASAAAVSESATDIAPVAPAPRGPLVIIPGVEDPVMLLPSSRIKIGPAGDFTVAPPPPVVDPAIAALVAAGLRSTNSAKSGSQHGPVPPPAQAVASSAAPPESSSSGAATTAAAAAAAAPGSAPPASAAAAAAAALVAELPVLSKAQMALYAEVEAIKAANSEERARSKYAAALSENLSRRWEARELRLRLMHHAQVQTQLVEHLRFALDGRQADARRLAAASTALLARLDHEQAGMAAELRALALAQQDEIRCAVAEAEELRARNHDTAQYQQDKPALVSRVEDYKGVVVSEHSVLAQDLAQLAARHALEVDSLKSEMLRRIRETKLSLLELSHSQVHDTTKRTQANTESIITELQYQRRALDRARRRRARANVSLARGLAQLDALADEKTRTLARVHLLRPLLAALRARRAELEEALEAGFAKHAADTAAGAPAASAVWDAPAAPANSGPRRGGGPFTFSRATAAASSPASSAVSSATVSASASQVSLSGSARAAGRASSLQAAAALASQLGLVNSDDDHDQDGATAAALRCRRLKSKRSRGNVSFIGLTSGSDGGPADPGALVPGAAEETAARASVLTAAAETSSVAAPSDGATGAWSVFTSEPSFGPRPMSAVSRLRAASMAAASLAAPAPKPSSLTAGHSVAAPMGVTIDGVTGLVTLPPLRGALATLDARLAASRAPASARAAPDPLAATAAAAAASGGSQSARGRGSSDSAGASAPSGPFAVLSVRGLQSRLDQLQDQLRAARSGLLIAEAEADKARIAYTEVTAHLDPSARFVLRCLLQAARAVQASGVCAPSGDSNCPRTQWDLLTGPEPDPAADNSDNDDSDDAQHFGLLPIRSSDLAARWRVLDLWFALMASANADIDDDETSD